MYGFSNLALLLIPVTYWNIFCILYKTRASRNEFAGLLETAILSGLALIGFAWSGVILLSLWGHLEWISMTAWWGAGFALSFIAALKDIPPTLQILTKKTRGVLAQFDFSDWSISAVILIVLIAALVMGLCSPPNNGDSMRYHLPRQILWMSSKTVFIEQAPHEFMLKMPPLSEYLGVNLWLLGDTDRFHNLVQFLALCGCFILLSMIVQSFGCGKKGALLGSLFAVTVPAVFYQASNTKNDIVLSFFLLCILWVVECSSKEKKFSFLAATIAGFCIAGALMTKGTALVYLCVLLPYAVLRIFPLYRRDKTGVFSSSSISIIIVIALISPHYFLEGKKIADGDLSQNRFHVNQSFNFKNTASVLVRNVADQIALPWESWNQMVEAFVADIHKILRCDENAPETTFINNPSPFKVTYWPIAEDNATSIIHFLFILIFPLIGIGFFSTLWKRDSFGYWFLPLLMLLIFSAIFKWQPYHTRLLIPVEIIGAIPFAVLFSLLGSKMLELFFTGLTFLWLCPCFGGWHRTLFGEQPVYEMKDIYQRTMKEDPAHCYEYIAIADLLSHIQPRTIQLNDAFYPPLVYMGRIHRMWPKITLIGDHSENCDVRLRRLTKGEVPPPPGIGMRRAYESSQVCVDLADNLYSIAKMYPSTSFAGLENMKGLDTPIGPFPKYKLPIFMNAHYPEAGFKIYPDKERRFLHMEISLPFQNDLASNSCQISMNGEIKSNLKMTTRGKTNPVKIEIPVSENPAVITMNFEKYDSPNHLAASLTLLQLSSN